MFQHLRKNWFHNDNKNININVDTTNSIIMYDNCKLHYITDDKKIIWFKTSELEELFKPDKFKEPLISSDDLMSWLNSKSKYKVHHFNFQTTLLPLIKQEYNNIDANFYSSNLITDYKNKNVVYIASTDNINSEGHKLYKYGITSRIIERDLKEHKKVFTNFMLLYIKECDNKEVIESLLETELKAKNLWKSEVINKNKYTELFILTEQYTIDDIISILNTLIIHNLPEHIKSYQNKIKELESNHEIEKLKLEIEKIRLTNEQKKLDLELLKQRKR
jgi:hypothetical protein